MKFIFFIVSMLFSFVSVMAQTKRALVIGLGEQEDKAWAKINGDNDVPLVVEMLRSAGFNMLVLVGLIKGSDRIIHEMMGL